MLIVGNEDPDPFFFFAPGVCVPCDPVAGEPLLPGAAGDPGPVPHLHPGGEAAERPTGPADQWKPPEPKRETR